MHKIKFSSLLVANIRNGSWVFSEKLVRLFSGIFVGAWIARYLGVELFGVYSYIASVIAISSGFLKLGLDNIATREFVNHPKHHAQYFSNIFWIKTTASIVFFSITLILYFSHRNSEILLYVCIVSLGFIFKGFEVINFYFQAKSYFKLISLINITQVITSSALKIYLIQSNASIIYIFYIFAFDSFFLSLMYIIAYRKKKSLLASINLKSLSINKVVETTRESMSLMASAIIVLIIFNLDKLLIKELLSEGGKNLGLFSSAFSIITMCIIIPLSIGEIISPKATKLYQKNKTHYKKLKHLSYCIIIIISLSLSYIFYILSEQIIFLLYGNDYMLSASILKILTWSILGISIVTIRNRFLIIEKNKSAILHISIYSFIFHFLVSFLLISLYGITGAAYSFTFSWIFNACLTILPQFKVMTNDTERQKS